MLAARIVGGLHIHAFVIKQAISFWSQMTYYAVRLLCNLFQPKSSQYHTTLKILLHNMKGSIWGRSQEYLVCYAPTYPLKGFLAIRRLLSLDAKFSVICRNIVRVHFRHIDLRLLMGTGVQYFPMSDVSFCFKGRCRLEILIIYCIRSAS